MCVCVSVCEFVCEEITGKIQFANYLFMVYKIYVRNYVHGERVISELKIFESIDVFVEIAFGQT